MVMHSSPIEFYESINCRGKLVEQMTSDECAKCQMEITKNTFVKVPDLLAWAENKVNVMFCVKESTDIPRAITSLVEYNAAHRAFLEVHTDDYLQLEANATPSWDQVYYVVEMRSHDELIKLVNDLVLAAFRRVCNHSLFTYLVSSMRPISYANALSFWNSTIGRTGLVSLCTWSIFLDSWRSTACHERRR